MGLPAPDVQARVLFRYSIRSRVVRSRGLSPWDWEFVSSGPLEIQQALRQQCWGGASQISKVLDTQNVSSVAADRGAAMLVGPASPCSPSFAPKTQIPIGHKASQPQVSTCSLNIAIGYSKISSTDGHQGDMPYCTAIFRPRTCRSVPVTHISRCDAVLSDALPVVV